MPRPRDPKAKGDTTQSRRQNKRQSTLDKIARAAGWESWSAYETAVKNGLVSIAPAPK